jgi:hypothetical protein
LLELDKLTVRTMSVITWMPMWSAFSKDAREVFEHFNFEASITLLEDA